jgi:hypothetical protein
MIVHGCIPLSASFLSCVQNADQSAFRVGNAIEAFIVQLLFRFGLPKQSLQYCSLFRRQSFDDTWGAALLPLSKVLGGWQQMYGLAILTLSSQLPLAVFYFVYFVRLS